MSIHTRILSSAITFCATVLSISSASAQLFVDNFNNATTGNITLTTYGNGWAGYMGSTGTNISSAVASATQDGLGVTSTDYLFATNDVTASQTFAAITTFSAITVANGTQISFLMGNTSTSSSIRLLVQVGGGWYATASTFTNSGWTGGTFATAVGNGTAPSYGISFSTTASNWVSLNFNPGTLMSLGSTPGSDLSSNDITGIGFFITDSTQSQPVRLDTLTIVPEPSTYALVIAALLGLGLLRLRTRQTA